MFAVGGIISNQQEMVVGREDGVYFFSPEDRGGAAGFEGKKQFVGCLWNYILVREREKGGRERENNIVHTCPESAPRSALSTPASSSGKPSRLGSATHGACSCSDSA